MEFSTSVVSSFFLSLFLEEKRDIWVWVWVVWTYETSKSFPVSGCSVASHAASLTGLPERWVGCDGVVGTDALLRDGRLYHEINNG